MNRKLWLCTRLHRSYRTGRPEKVRPTPISEIIDIVQKISTIVALGVGAIWALWLFSQERKPYFKMNIIQKPSVIAFSDTDVLLRVDVTLENKGSRLVKAFSGAIHVQQILPDVAGVVPPAVSNPYIYPRLSWPVLRITPLKRVDNVSIEPSEAHTESFDFVLTKDIHVVNVHVHINNPSRNDGSGWDSQTIVDLRKS